MSADSGLTPVQVNFTLDTRFGRMDVSAVVPKERIDLVQLQPALKELSSNLVNAVAGAAVREGREISCKAGCGACCRQLVPISLFEAEDLANWIATLPEDQQAILERRFLSAVEKLREAGVLEHLKPSDTAKRRSGGMLELGLEYMKVGVACPFLENESCGIHPIRPVVCREYLVTSPAEFCAHPTPETVDRVPMPVELSEALMNLCNSLTAERQGWIPLTMLFGWIRAKASVAKAYEGTGPELLRLVVERIADTSNTAEAAQG